MANSPEGIPSTALTPPPAVLERGDATATEKFRDPKTTLPGNARFVPNRIGF
jgi:hypothetical protein